jgi:hypothetical protein
MSKFYAGLMAVLCVVTTALMIGWVNDLDYWKRIRTINFELTRPQTAKAGESVREITESTAPAMTKDVPTPSENKVDKPTDRENADSWLSWARATRGRDSNWMPPVYNRLEDIKSVQNGAIEFRVAQIEDSNSRIIVHHGERFWLTGNFPGLVLNKAYICKGLYAPTGTYQFKTATEGTQSLASFRYLGEAPDLFAPVR